MTMDSVTSTTGGVVKDGFRYVFPIPNWTGSAGDINKSYHTAGASDLFAAEGTPIVAMIGGHVTGAGYDNVGGNYVMIRGHDGLDYYYAHMQNAPSVVKGNFVEMGQRIGNVGQTGNAQGTGAHLHIGIGRGIGAGTGPSGGAGINFDAKGLLGQILQAGGATFENIIDAGSDVIGSIGAVTTILSDLPGTITKNLGIWTKDVIVAAGQYITDWFDNRIYGTAFLTVGIIIIIAGLLKLAEPGVMRLQDQVGGAAVSVVTRGVASGVAKV